MSIEKKPKLKWVARDRAGERLLVASVYYTGSLHRLCGGVLATPTENMCSAWLLWWSLLALTATFLVMSPSSSRCCFARSGEVDVVHGAAQDSGGFAPGERLGRKQLLK